MYDEAEREWKVPCYSNGERGGIFSPATGGKRVWIGPKSFGREELLYESGGVWFLVFKYDPERGKRYSNDDVAVMLSKPEAGRWFDRNGYDLPPGFDGDSALAAAKSK